MLIGIITRNSSGSITLEVTGNEQETFLFYSLSAAKQLYRQRHNLQHRHIRWYESTELLKGLM